MTSLILKSQINSSIQKVFNLSRDIDFHMQSASQTKEIAIGGVTTGLIGIGETVKWRGKHFGVWLTHTSLITEMEYPAHFTDEMTQGHFKSFKHQHIFEEHNGLTLMIDSLSYEVPYGWAGKVLNKVFLKRYLENFIKHRNRMLQKSLERKDDLL